MKTKKDSLFICLAVEGKASLDDRLQVSAWGTGTDLTKAKRNCIRFIDIEDAHWNEESQNQKGWLLGKMPSASHAINLENRSYNMGSILTYTREADVKDKDADITWINLSQVQQLHEGAKPPWTGSNIESDKPTLVLVT
tara:strand:+ start:394 stop:810 length:417 start_codon:yes stop_codon:yes gene_type:complete